jgi:MFS family permease
MFHYLGLVLVLLSWAAGAYLLTKWRNVDLPTLSKHGASSLKAHLFFGSALTILGTPFYYWLITWFKPHLQLGVAFTVLITIAIVCQVLAGIIPDTTGWRRHMHRVTAYTMAVLYLPLAALITLADLPLATRLICLGLIVYMAVSFTMLVLLHRAQQKFLQYQILYVMAFQVLILLAAYGS